MSRYIIDMGDEKWDIRTGFDDGFMGYWLTVEHYDTPAEKLQDYVFHNMRDIKGVAMTLVQVISILAQLDIGMPYQLALELVCDAVRADYPIFLENQQAWDVLADFKKLYGATLSGDSEDWMLQGKSPVRWVCMDTGYSESLEV